MKDNVWDFKVRDMTLVVTPRIEQMQEYIADRAEDLSRRLQDAEELLIIQACSDETLEKLKRVCTEELKRRKETPVKL